MMKKYTVALLLHAACLPQMVINGMQTPQSARIQKCPVDTNWFYSKSHPFSQANNYYQKQQWTQAVQEYQQVLQKNVGSDYDKAMARLIILAAYSKEQHGSTAF